MGMTMENIVENPQLHNREFIFVDRDDAGGKLGQLLREKTTADGLLLAIPSGGVPVAVAMRDHLRWPLDLLLVRKVQIPWNTEAGFGAVNLDGDRIFNEPLLRSLHLTAREEERQVAGTMQTLAHRNELFRGSRPFPEIMGRDIILVDDGLASGFTMLAAIMFVRRRKPSSITVAVPTGVLDTCTRIASEVDRLFCLNIREHYPFAVAGAYVNWYDLTDQDVLRLLDRA
jgi:predicted phosphoribosyltransferase